MTDLLQDAAVREALDRYGEWCKDIADSGRSNDTGAEAALVAAITSAHLRQLVGTPDGMERLRVRVTATGAEVEVLRGRASVVVSDAEIARAATDPDTEALRRAVAETAGMEAPEEHICTKANTDDCLIGQECDGYWEEYRIAVIEAAAPHLLAPLQARLQEAEKERDEALESWRATLRYAATIRKETLEEAEERLAFVSKARENDLLAMAEAERTSAATIVAALWKEARAVEIGAEFHSDTLNGSPIYNAYTWAIKQVERLAASSKEGV